MSNYLAIATVTAALGRMVHAAAESSGVGSVSLDFGRPTAIVEGQTARKVHIYLYQVNPNTAWRNSDLPARDSEGRLVDRPRTALNLRYLLAFYGSQQTLEPDRMLGAVVRNLHARPLLSRQSIQDAISEHSELAASNLAEAIERVRLTPAALSLDEFSRIWSVFFQTPHALSVVYEADMVLIEAEEGGPSALPVLRRGPEDRGVVTEPDLASPFPVLDGIHIGAPEDVGVEPLPPSYPRAQLGGYLVLRGRNFRGDTIEVEFSHSRFSEPNHPRFLAPKRISIPLADRTPTEIRMTIPSNVAAQSEWRVGLYALSILVSAGGKTHTSNALALLLAPRVTGIEPHNPIPRDGDGNVTIALSVSPTILRTQTAALLFASLEIEAAPRGADTDPLQFVIQQPPAVADSVLRLRVDGVDSIPFERIGMPPQFQFAESQKVTIP